MSDDELRDRLLDMHEDRLRKAAETKTMMPSMSKRMAAQADGIKLVVIELLGLSIGEAKAAREAAKGAAS